MSVTYGLTVVCREDVRHLTARRDSLKVFTWLQLLSPTLLAHTAHVQTPQHIAQDKITLLHAPGEEILSALRIMLSSSNLCLQNHAQDQLFINKLSHNMVQVGDRQNEKL